MKTKTIRLAIRWKTWRSVRRLFPAEYNESAADYFERLAEHIKAQSLKEK